MSDVTFNDDTEVAPRKIVRTKKDSIFVRTVVSLGLAKDAAGAQIVLLVIAVAGIVFAILVQVWMAQTYPATKTPSATTQTKK